MKHLSKMLLIVLAVIVLSTGAKADPEPFDDIDARIPNDGAFQSKDSWNLPKSDVSSSRRIVVAGVLSSGVEYELYSDGLLHLHGADITTQLKDEVNLRSNISKINSISFGEGVENIENYAISDIASLETVYFSENVKSVGEHAFSGCSSLSQLNGEGHIYSIGMYAFSGCAALESVSLTEIRSIGQYAFYNCSKLQTISIGKDLEEMQTRVFEGCTSLNTVEIASSIPDQAFSGISSIRSAYVKEPATMIGKEAFSYCSALNSVTIDESVYSIGAGAFEKCSSITSLTLPESLNTIGEYAFSECTGLRMLSMPMTLERIGAQAFYQCESLTDIEIFAANIGNRAFAGCAALKNVNFGNPLTKIGIDVLSGCRLDSITIACESIPARAFANMDVLQVTLKKSVLTIGESAFENSTVRNLVIPSALKTIENYAFRSCQNLESICDETGREVSIPASVHTLGKWIFYGCKSLQTLTIACPEVSAEALRGITGLESFTVKNTVRRIERRAFMDCAQLTLVDLGENTGIEFIGDEAFSGCTSVTRVRIPLSVKEIGSKIFLNCDGSIRSIVYCGTTADWYKVNVDKDIKKWTGVSSYISWNLKNSVEYKNWK